MCDELDRLNEEIERLSRQTIQGGSFQIPRSLPVASTLPLWESQAVHGTTSELNEAIVQHEHLFVGLQESGIQFPLFDLYVPNAESSDVLVTMLSDTDPLLPSSSAPFQLDLQGSPSQGFSKASGILFEHSDMSTMEDTVSSELSQVPESEQSQDLMDIGSQASTVDEKEDQSNDDTENIDDDSGKVVQPTSKEFKKTWGFRRTTIAKRELPGEVDFNDPLNAPLRRSGRQSKRTDKMEEFLSTSKRRGRRSAPANLESFDPTDTETASEASFDGNSEAKTPSQASVESLDLKATPDDDGGKNEPDAAAASQDSSEASDSDELTLKELQNQLRKKRVAGAPGAEEEGLEEVESAEKPVDETGSKGLSGSPGRGGAKESAINDAETKPGQKGSKDAGREGPSTIKSDAEGYDPNALYCICRQKHNNRFMICCDRCEEWFHGNCVGITEARGRLLERNGEDYICPNCTRLRSQGDRTPLTGEEQPELKSGKTSEDQTAAPTDAEKPSEDQGIKGRIEKATNPSGKKKIKLFHPVVETSTLPKCIGSGCSNHALPDSVYCGNDCILRHAAAAMKSLTEVKEPKPKEKPKLKVQRKSPLKTPPKGQKRVGPERKVVKKTTVMVSRPAGTSEPETDQSGQESHMPSWSSDHNYNAVQTEKTAAISSSVFYKSSAKETEGDGSKMESTTSSKQPSGPSSTTPAAKQHHASGGATAKAKKHPPPSATSSSASKKTPPSLNKAKNLKSLSPAPSTGLSASKHHASGALSITKTSYTIPKKLPSTSGASPAARQPSGSSVTAAPAAPSKPALPSASQPQPNNQIRQNIRRSLTEILYKRVSDSDDLDISENEVGKIAFNIEKEMFSMFQNTDNKYKNKYRSIMFNLKDPKNKGLFYRVIGAEISPYKLVRLNPEELLCREVSEWRERETNEAQESSQKSQREPQKYGLKQENVPDVDMEESPPMSDGDEQEEPKPTPPKSTLPVPDIFSSMLKDTTSEHRAHLFDLNCKICTGQMSAEEEPVPKKPKISVTNTVKKPEPKIKQEARPTMASDSEGSPKTADGKLQCAPSSTTAESTPEPKWKTEVHHPITDSPASPEQPSSPISTSSSFTPIPIPAVSSVTIMHRDPRTAGYRPSVTVTPAPLIVPTEAPPASTTAAGLKTEITKPAMPPPPPAVPKSILLKPVSSPDTRYFSTSSSSVSIAESRSPQDGETTVFLAKQEIAWKGFINMHTVAKFVTKAYLVSGSSDFLAEDLPDTVHIGGRISPHTVWDYVGKLKSSLSKELCLIRFHPATEEEEVAYISLYSYFSSRGRFGVVANNNRRIKDLYLIPLSAKDSIPSKLLPFDGPGLESSRPNLLLGLVICQKLKRPGAPSDPEKGEEKKLKVQVQEEDDVSSLSKATTLSKPESKSEKPLLYNPEMPISTTPPGSPPSGTSSESSSSSFTTPSVFSLLSSVKAATAKPTAGGGETPPSGSSATASSTPLQQILNTLFGKKKPSESTDSSQSTPEQSAVELTVSSAPVIDPIVQQFGQISQDKTLDEDDYDRPYDPEEEYDPEKLYGMDTPVNKNKLFQTKKVCEAPEVDEEAYDPEDETIFEEAKVVVSDFPSRVLGIKSKDRPANYIAPVNDSSSLTEQQKMLEELNKQIDEQKRQLEEQEEALRQQRAAVGVSMAHFSVSDALMSPPPKSLVANSDSIQLGKKAEAIAKPPSLPKPAQVINQRRDPRQSKDPRQSRDPRQAATRRPSEKEEVTTTVAAEVSVSPSQPVEALNQPAPNVEPESMEMSIPLLGEKIEPYPITSETVDIKLIENSAPPSGQSAGDAFSEAASSPFTSWPDPSSHQSPGDFSSGPVRPTRKVLLPTPSQPPMYPPPSDSVSPVLSSQPESTHPTVSMQDAVHMSQMGMPNPEFMNQQEVQKVPFQSQSGPPHFEGQTNQSQFRDERESYPFQEQWRGSPQQFDGPRGPPPPHMMGQGAPVPFQPMGQRGPPPSRFAGPRGPPPPQNLGQFQEGHGTSHGQNEPPQPRFGGPGGPHFPGPRGPHPPFMGPAPGQFENRGPPPSHFQGPPPPHQFGEQGPPQPFMDPQRGHEEKQYDNSNTYPQGMEHHRAQPPPHMLRDNNNRTSSPSPLMGQRGPSPNQFDGPRGPPPNHFDGPRGPTPNQFDGPRGPVPNQFDGPRGPAPNQFDGPRVHRPTPPGDMGGHRFPPPNQFGGPRGPPPHLQQGQRVPSPQPRGPPPQNFEEYRGPPQQFQGQRGPPQPQFGGSCGPGPSQFPDKGGRPRFHYEGQPHPQDGRAAHHPRPLLPNPPEQPQEGWNKGHRQNRFERDPESEPDEHWQSPDMRGRDRGRGNSEPRNNGERQRDRFDAGSRERANPQGPVRQSDERQNRLSEERRRDRDGAHGRPWERNQGKPWSREREWDRNRERDRDRDSDRNRSRDCERHRDRDQAPEQEVDRNRERDQTRGRGRDRESDRRDHERDRTRNRDRERDRDHDRETHRRRDRDRSRSRDRERGRDRDRDRDRTKDRDRDRDSRRDRERKDRSKSKEKGKDTRMEAKNQSEKTVEAETAAEKNTSS
ncbi:death-inducer obliterator 1-like isoform X2 [Acipenser ruthenus]|uniref:death-inducer obliterator 1-like isoform X2 n=1 Tax=Acipenser ruthenus TaxID=7906 RepID=UPI0027426D52|nr:death-inducer obliterator 1-like isoform X2 [Acipenser ruthenus]